MIYFTSDTHFNHGNVIKYCDRPFRNSAGEPDVWYMNRTMTDRWNETVKENDTIIHIGDFAMGQRSLLKPTLDRLNGYKILILGNHDRSKTAMLEAGFNEVHSELYLELGHPNEDSKSKVKLYLHHQPMLEGEHLARWRARADYHLCGHIHEKWARRGDAINVGVDQWDFRPVTLEQLLKREETPYDPKQDERERE